MVPGCKLELLKFEELTNYQNDHEESHIRLSFESYIDINECMGFIVFIYQDRRSTSENSLVFYDIDEQ